MAWENKIQSVPSDYADHNTTFKKSIDLSHHPYFNEVYKYADIKLARGRAFLNVKTRIDIEIQQATFISANGIEIPIDPGLAKEINYADTTVEGIFFYKFKTGFPNIDRQNTYFFYQVLADGRCSLLKSVYKKVKEKLVVVFSEYEREYETFEDYYLYSKGVMKKLKKDKEFFLAELNDKQEEISRYILTNKTNFKNNEQLIGLLNYYNSLSF